MLGTHNSLSYLHSQWWLKPFEFMFKCQNLTIQEQYDFGVRYFDIRVKFKGNRVISGHGLATYDVGVNTVLSFINSFPEHCLVRLYYEETKRFSDFLVYVKDCINKYTNIEFVGTSGREINYTLFKPLPEHECCHLDTGLPENKWKLPQPLKWAKKNNHLLTKDSDFDLHTRLKIFDFVEIRELKI